MFKFLNFLIKDKVEDKNSQLALQVIEWLFSE